MDKYKVDSSKRRSEGWKPNLKGGFYHMWERVVIPKTVSFILF
jgi:hypothetical protein